MNRVIHYWQQRQPREHGLLLLLAAIICVALFYSTQQSVQGYQQQAAQRQQQAGEQLAAMHAQSAGVARLLARKKQQQDAGWQVQVLSAAATFQPGLTAQPQENGRLRFTSGQANPDQLLPWLAVLEQEKQVRASQLELRASPQGMQVDGLELLHDR